MKPDWQFELLTIFISSWNEIFPRGGIVGTLHTIPNLPVTLRRGGEIYQQIE